MDYNIEGVHEVGTTQHELPVELNPAKTLLWTYQRNQVGYKLKSEKHTCKAVIVVKVIIQYWHKIKSKSVRFWNLKGLTMLKLVRKLQYNPIPLTCGVITGLIVI